MLTATYILMSLALGASPDSAPAADAVTGTPRADSAALVSEQQLRDWVTQLGHPRFSLREDATRALCKVDIDQLPDLVRLYRAETRYEPKRRIRYIIESIFHRDQIIGRNGFVGLLLYGRVIPNVTDPVAGAATRGVLIKQVVPDFPAARGGVKDGDFIVAFNNKPVPVPEDPGNQTKSFIHFVASHRPGTVVPVRVLRSDKPRKIGIDVKGDISKALDGAAFDAVVMEYRLPPTPPVEVIWVSSVTPGSAADAAGLRVNDILTAVDNAPLSVPDGQPVGPHLAAWLRSPHPGGKPTLGVVRSEAVTLTITIGSRPPERLIEGDPLFGADKVAAQARFLQWWQDQGGDLSLHPQDQQFMRTGNPPQQPAMRIPENLVIP